MSYVGRFAPSPTGPLHFGSLVAAVASYLDARAAAGRWLLRIEDVDTTRAMPGAADGILRTLEALGFEWDGEVEVQSRRTARYEAALEKLRATGHVYACKCSRREIADSALAGIEGPVYPGTCRGLRLPTGPERAERMRAGAGRISFEDRVQGRIEQDLGRELGDFVLKRRDGLHAYQLAVVVDDGDQGVTDVVRGADLIGSTPRQILLQRALGLSTPRYLHVPAATNARGEKLSKQTGAAAVDALHPGEAIAAALAFLAQPAPGAASPRELLGLAAATWDAASIPKSASLHATFSDKAAKTPGV